MTVPLRQWSARGGPLMLGKIVPGASACIGVVALTAGAATIRQYGWRDSSPSWVILVALAAIAGWLAWRLLRTAWLIVLAEGTFTCLATGGRWTFEPGEILAVRGDVYHQFLHIVGARNKITLWAQITDRESLFTAIRRANPHVEFAPWIQSTNE